MIHRLSQINLSLTTGFFSLDKIKIAKKTKSIDLYPYQAPSPLQNIPTMLYMDC